MKPSDRLNFEYNVMVYIKEVLIFCGSATKMIQQNYYITNNRY